jgi:hypothetical protein
VRSLNFTLSSDILQPDLAHHPDTKESGAKSHSHRANETSSQYINTRRSSHNETALSNVHITTMAIWRSWSYDIDINKVHMSNASVHCTSTSI